MIATMTDPLIWHILDVVHFNTPDPGVKLRSGIDRHSSTFEDGVFGMPQIRDLFAALRTKPLIIEGTPQFPSDLVWFLRWELERKNNNEMSVPAPVLGATDPSEVGDASVIP